MKMEKERLFKQLFDEYYTPLCVYAHRYIPDMKEAEEVVQNAFVKIWNQPKIYTSLSFLKNYTYRTVHNDCVNYLNKSKVHRNYLKAIKNQYPQEPFVQTSELFELEKLLDQALEQLSPQVKKVFLLNRFGGLKYKEVAEALDLSPKTVESHMSKALAFLREELKDYL
ncbi:RNA polymerase sigma-70 factor [Rapidithrix thailandica]|uniref:RNA polymerase sigma-70 factor n=1 Tax=Rapidithrix thailandica TaxID=413964 RepID=A0AAW9S341_9BACT